MNTRMLSDKSVHTLALSFETAALFSGRNVTLLHTFTISYITQNLVLFSVYYSELPKT
jgi:hypothetical protein